MFMIAYVCTHVRTYVCTYVLINVVMQESAEGERAAKEKLGQERRRLCSEKTELESRVVALEMQAKEKESEIVLLSGRVESQEAEIRSEYHTQLRVEGANTHMAAKCSSECSQPFTCFLASTSFTYMYANHNKN